MTELRNTSPLSCLSNKPLIAKSEFPNTTIRDSAEGDEEVGGDEGVAGDEEVAGDEGVGLALV